MSYAESYGLVLKGEVATFQEIVQLWQDRDERFEDIDSLKRKGGEDWLINTLNTHPANGIRQASVAEREARFGSNRQKRQPPPCSRG
jgi:hypothetical protein